MYHSLCVKDAWYTQYIAILKINLSFLSHFHMLCMIWSQPGWDTLGWFQ